MSKAERFIAGSLLDVQNIFRSSFVLLTVDSFVVIVESALLERETRR
jgi:hypothetical protein